MTTVSVTELPDELVKLIHGLNAGESITIVDEAGKPEAVLVAIDEEPSGTLDFKPVEDEWLKEWNDLASAITRDWKVDKSALEIVIEGKR
jgi:antitoxin (DNA-binding transcriptional repressor) of toxin-antitoxin stability system